MILVSQERTSWFAVTFHHDPFSQVKDGSSLSSLILFPYVQSGAIKSV